jgi:sulfate adenylyltransferase
VVESKYQASKPLECKNCYGTASLEHPGVVMVAMEKGKYYLSGSLKGLNLPVRDFPCKTPQEVSGALVSEGLVIVCVGWLV